MIRVVSQIDDMHTHSHPLSLHLNLVTCAIWLHMVAATVFNFSNSDKDWPEQEMVTNCLAAVADQIREI